LYASRLAGPLLLGSELLVVASLPTCYLPW
jgi:hypothetical protein